MARINVSVPDTMRERMSALDQQVNWSEVAQLAFEREIVKHNLEIENMEQVIERLKASRADFESSEDARGRKDGHEWACRFATYGELKALTELRLEGDHFATRFDAALGKNPSDDESFWVDEEAGRVKYPSDKYVYGFWDAADDVFIEIEDKL